MPTICNAQLKDAKEIAQMIHQTIYSTMSVYYPDCSLKYLSNSLNENNIKERIQNTHFYIAKEENKIVGCGAIKFIESKKECEILNIFVNPTYQRLGIGKQIMATLQNDVYYQNAKRIEVHSSITGIPFYRKLGYKFKDEELIYDDGCFILEKFN